MYVSIYNSTGYLKLCFLYFKPDSMPITEDLSVTTTMTKPIHLTTQDLKTIPQTLKTVLSLILPLCT